MNILVIGLNFDEGFARYLADEFRAMGHAITLFDPETAGLSERPRSTSIFRKGMQRLHATLSPLEIYRRMFEWRLFGVVESIGHLDLIVVCSDFLYPKTVASLKSRTRAPAVMWLSDPVSSFRRHMFLNAPYDALFFKDPYIVHIVKNMVSQPIYYLPECYNEHELYPVQLSDDDARKYGCDIATAGNIYSYRIAVMKELAAYDVKLWGNPPPSWALFDHMKPMIQHEYVARIEKAKAFRGAKIVLNSMFPAEIWGVNVRAFEIAGAGGFQLLDWRPGLSQLFVDGRELVSFRGMADLQTKIAHYLSAADERAEIAAAGHRRARADHTYRQRLALMLDTVFKPGVAGFPLPDIDWTVRNG